MRGYLKDDSQYGNTSRLDSDKTTLREIQYENEFLTTIIALCCITLKFRDFICLQQHYSVTIPCTV